MGSGREVVVAAPENASLASALAAALAGHGWTPAMVTGLPVTGLTLPPTVLLLEDDAGRTPLGVPQHRRLDTVAAVGSTRSLPTLLLLARRGAEVLNQNVPFTTLLRRIEELLTSPADRQEERPGRQIIPLRRRLQEHRLLATLSEAELDVLHRLANGHTVAEIAAASNRSTHTVRSHARSVRGKLRVTSQLAAVGMWWRDSTSVDLDELARFTTPSDAPEGAEPATGRSGA